MVGHGREGSDLVESNIGSEPEQDSKEQSRQLLGQMVVVDTSHQQHPPPKTREGQDPPDSILGSPTVLERGPCLGDVEEKRKFLHEEEPGVSEEEHVARNIDSASPVSSLATTVVLRPVTVDRAAPSCHDKNAVKESGSKEPLGDEPPIKCCKTPADEGLDDDIRGDFGAGT